MKFMTERRLFLIALAFALTAVTATPAAAYVGPGAGLSLLGALWGLAIALGAAVGFILLWPFRRMLRRKSAARKASRQSAKGESIPATPEAAHSSEDGVSRHGAA